SAVDADQRLARGYRAECIVTYPARGYLSQYTVAQLCREEGDEPACPRNRPYQYLSRVASSGARSFQPLTFLRDHERERGRRVLCEQKSFRRTCLCADINCSVLGNRCSVQGENLCQSQSA